MFLAKRLGCLFAADAAGPAVQRLAESNHLLLAGEALSLLSNDLCLYQSNLFVHVWDIHSVAMGDVRSLILNAVQV